MIADETGQLLQPVPGTEILQAIQVAILFAAAIYLARYVFTCALSYFVWPMGPNRASKAPANGDLNLTVPRPRILMGPMFDDGEVRWIRWSK